MRLAAPRHNVELRERPERGGQVVVLAFPYRQDVVDAVRAISGRRFDWDARKRDLVAAVTDGRERHDEPLVQTVARELRHAPIRHLKAV